MPSPSPWTRSVPTSSGLSRSLPWHPRPHSPEESGPLYTPCQNTPASPTAPVPGPQWTPRIGTLGSAARTTSFHFPPILAQPGPFWELLGVTLLFLYTRVTSGLAALEERSPTTWLPMHVQAGTLVPLYVGVPEEGVISSGT